MPDLMPWHHLPVPDVLRAFASEKGGLTESEARLRSERQGKNVLTIRRPKRMASVAFRQFANPLMTVLAFAALMSAFLFHWADVFLIIAIIVLNAALGFFQEYKADRALFQLTTLLPQTARVRRDGVVREVESSEIVPGDIVLFSAGDKVTADGRILSSSTFATRESALSGESADIEKDARPVSSDAQLADQTSMVFSGTVVTSGKAEVVVTATGMHTEFGKIADLVDKTAEEETPLQKELKRFSNTLALLMSLVAICVFLLGFVKGWSVLELLPVAAALAVAAVPEGLLVSLTTIFAVGMRRMAKRKALVRKMIAAETLGSVTVMCLDKTGTLTTGEMSVEELRFGVRKLSASDTSADAETVRFLLSRVVEGDGERGSLTEVAVKSYLMHHEGERRSGTVLEELPFHSGKKFSGKVWEESGKRTLYVWGAPEVLFAKTDFTDVERSAYHKTLEDMVARGLRVLFLGKRELLGEERVTGDIVRDVSPLGFVGLKDDVRPNAKEMIATAARAGVRTIMITGDHPETARAVAQALDLPVSDETLLTGAELETLTDVALIRRVQRVTVCARVLPGQKVRILEALKMSGEVVAMTGDGVNDAPALRAADIGVAVGSGTAVAKETADMVLLNDDVGSLVTAMAEGRVIFENIRKVTAFLLIFSLSEVALVGAAILFRHPLPLGPLHILWINVVTDGLPAIALAFEPGEKGLMRELPRKKDEPFLSSPLKAFIVSSLVITVTALLIFQATLFSGGASLEHTRTLLFLSLGCDSLFAVFVIRHFRGSALAVGQRKNFLLIFAFVLSFIILVVPVTLPALKTVFGFVTVSYSDVTLLSALTLAKVFLFEGAKKVIFSLHRPQSGKLLLYGQEKEVRA